MAIQHKGPNRHPFAAVVSLRDKLTVAGTEELVRKVLAREAPNAKMPGDWTRGWEPLVRYADPNDPVDWDSEGFGLLAHDIE